MSVATEKTVASSLDDAVAEAIALIVSAVSAQHTEENQRSLVDVPTSREAIAATADQMLAQARQEVRYISMPDGAMGGLSAGVVRRLRLLAERAVEAQVLWCAPAEPVAPQERALAALAEVLDLRVTKAPLQELLLVDRRVALVISRIGPAQRQAIVVHTPAILRTFCGMFTSSWATGQPADLLGAAGGRLQGEVTRRVLGLLGNGVKDDVAARELGMSVRTYRRYVADFMRDIDAGSRFQAGVRASELGLLPG